MGTFMKVVNDTNENVVDKSWFSSEDVERTEAAMKQAFFITKGGEIR